MDEGQRWQGASYWLMRRSIDVTEAHAIIGELHDSVVRERDAEDIRRQILERGCTTADLTTIDYPRLCPDCGWNFPTVASLTQCCAQLCAKQDR
jgi:hypothetical protein